MTTDLYDRDVHSFPRGHFPPPEPFVVERDVEPTMWIDERLLPINPPDQEGVPIGHIVPSGFEAYARVFHPARRFFGPSIEQSASLRWSEIAEARGKVVHPQMQIEALIDNRDIFDYEYWKAISTGGGEWLPPDESLQEIEALALLGLLRPSSPISDRAWFMLWDGYGDLGPGIDGIPRGMIHAGPAPEDAPAELAGHTFAYRHYLVFSGPLDGLTGWYRWRDEGPNYWWPDDRAWIVVTEIDGFSTYVGASGACIDEVLASTLLEALPIAVTDRFDLGSDTINGPPAR